MCNCNFLAYAHLNDLLKNLKLFIEVQTEEIRYTYNRYIMTINCMSIRFKGTFLGRESKLRLTYKVPCKALN